MVKVPRVDEDRDWLAEGRQEGLQEGRQEGLQEGRQEGEAAVTLRLLKSLLKNPAPSARIGQLPIR